MRDIDAYESRYFQAPPSKAGLLKAFKCQTRLTPQVDISTDAGNVWYFQGGDPGDFPPPTAGKVSPSTSFLAAVERVQTGSLRYYPPCGNATATIRFTVDDLGNSGEGGPQNASVRLTVVSTLPECPGMFSMASSQGMKDGEKLALGVCVGIAGVAAIAGVVHLLMKISKGRKMQAPKYVQRHSEPIREELNL